MKDIKFWFKWKLPHKLTMIKLVFQGYAKFKFLKEPKLGLYAVNPFGYCRIL